MPVIFLTLKYQNTMFGNRKPALGTKEKERPPTQLVECT